MIRHIILVINLFLISIIPNCNNYLHASDNVIMKMKYNDVVDTFNKGQGINRYQQIVKGAYSVRADSFYSINLSNCTFDGNVNLNEKYVENDSYINWDTFNGLTNFQNSNFDKKVSFNWSIFNEHVTYKCIFNGPVYFFETKFLGTAEFSYATFKGITYFNNTTFAGTVTFDGTTFSSNLTFHHCQFLSTVTFYNAQLPEYFDFSYVQRIDRTIDFTHVKNSMCYINLEGTDISKIRLNYNKIKLYFDPLTSRNFDDTCAVYEALLNNFKNNGQTDSYRELDLEYRKLKLEKNPNLQDYFAKIWWNFGYNREWIFYWTIGFFFIFFVINSFLLNYLNNKVYPITHLKARMVLEYRKRIKWYNFLWYRLWISMLYSCIIFFGIKLDIDKMRFTSILCSIYIYAFYFMGLLCLVFIGNYFLFK